MNDVCKLISTTITKDEIGNSIEKETSKDVFCKISSVTSNEFFKSAQIGLKAELKITIWLKDYSKEVIVEIEHIRYKVYRAYKKSADVIELYLSELMDNE